MKINENIIPYFKDEIIEIGQWNLDSNSQLDTLAYYLFLKDSYKSKEHAMWLELNPSVILDQKYFETKVTKAGQHYYEIALNMIRKEKIKCLKKK